jgi:hypothetical protein
MEISGKKGNQQEKRKLADEREISRKREISSQEGN